MNEQLRTKLSMMLNDLKKDLEYNKREISDLNEKLDKYVFMQDRLHPMITGLESLVSVQVKKASDQ